MAAKPKAPPVQRGPASDKLPVDARESSMRAGLVVPPDYPAGAIELLRSWQDGDEDARREQRETWEFLKRALDEDRPSYRKLFP